MEHEQDQDMYVFFPPIGNKLTIVILIYEIVQFCRSGIGNLTFCEYLLRILKLNNYSYRHKNPPK